MPELTLPARARLPEADRARPACDRLNALKLRTAGVAVAALVCGYAGVRLSLAPLKRLVTMAVDLAHGRGMAPPIDVPGWQPASELLQWLPQLAFLVLAGLVIAGFSAGRFGRLRARVLAVPLVLGGLLVAGFTPGGGNGPRQHLDLHTETQLLLGQYDEVERALAGSGAPQVLRHYVQAQIALRAGDRLALTRHGRPLLDAVDAVAYAHPDHPAIDRPTLDAALRFNPRVIHAVDAALNGQPLTEVGIRWAQQHQGWRAWTIWLGPATALVTGLALLGAALLLGPLWNTMRRRVARLGEVLEDDTPPLAFASKFPDRMVSAWLPSSHFNSRLGRGVAAVFVLALVQQGFAAWRTMQMASAEDMVTRHAPTEAAPAAPPGSLPCAFIGIWTASRNDSVYQVTLTGDGSFLAVPLAKGGYSDSTIRGRWAVDGSRMAWTYNQTPGRMVSAVPSDVNPIRDLTGRSFTLVEVNGELTRYNLVRHLDSATCPG